MDQLLDRDAAMDLYRRASRRVEHLLNDLSVDAATPIPHLCWTVGELAAHLDHAAQIAGELAGGKQSPFADLTRIAETNAKLLEQHPERDLELLASQFSAAISRMELEFNKMPDDFRVPWHGGLTMSPPQAMAMMSSELLVHGWDLTRATGQDWPIENADALLILYAISMLMPHFIDEATAAGFTASYELRLRGGATLLLWFHDGLLAVSEAEPGVPADCRISADPATFLLVGYGRGSQIAPILSGKVIAWGRKPWLAAKFTSLARKP